MFQDMEVGDNLMITANVIGCVDAEECAAVSVCVETKYSIMILLMMMLVMMMAEENGRIADQDLVT